MNTPVAGYYAFEMSERSVPHVARIWFGAPLDPVTGEEMDRSHRWQATRNGKPCDLESVWPLRRNGRKITKTQYDEMLVDVLEAAPRITKPGTAPGAGMYAVQLVKDGPLCPLKVWHQSNGWKVLINGKAAPLGGVVTHIGHETDPVGEVVVRGKKIDAGEYEHLLRVHEWAVRYAPTAPEANPRKPIDMNSMPPIQF